MFQRLRESLALALLAALPFHALAVTVLSNAFVGPGGKPLFALALWKEAVLGIIVLIALVEILNGSWKRSAISDQRSVFHFDWIDGCIVIALAWAIIQPIIINYPAFAQATAGKQLSIINFLYGFKYDFLPLCAFLILRRVPWSEWFFERVPKIVIAAGVIVSAYGLLTYLLPMSFFTSLGYSDLHSLYRANNSLPAFQMIESIGIRRMQSVMSGPNQLGLWLLIPFSIVLVSFVRGKALSAQRSAISVLLLLGLCIDLTFSRAAWIGAALILMVFAWHTVVRKYLLVYWLTGVLVLLGIGIVIAPQVFIRGQSFIGHIEKPREAVSLIASHPLGLGLGSAGPASNHLSDTCLHFDEGADISWAKDRNDICLFVGGVQAQPVEPACNCPLLTENWYLQWGVEMGWIGLFLSLLIPLLILWKIINYQLSIINFPVFLAFLGVSIAGLFLHSFEDSAVAYSLWLLLAGVFVLREKTK